MPLKNRLLLPSLLILLVSLLAIWFAPFAVSHSLRLWIWWKAREQKLTVKIDQIDAPFLRRVVVRGFRMTSAPDAAFHIDVSAAQATVNLNLKAILMRMGGRAIRTLSVEGLHAQLRRNYVTGTTLTESGWATFRVTVTKNSCNTCTLRHPVPVSQRASSSCSAATLFLPADASKA